MQRVHSICEGGNRDMEWRWDASGDRHHQRLYSGAGRRLRLEEHHLCCLGRTTVV